MLAVAVVVYESIEHTVVVGVAAPGFYDIENAVIVRVAVQIIGRTVIVGID